MIMNSCTYARINNDWKLTQVRFIHLEKVKVLSEKYFYRAKITYITNTQAQQNTYTTRIESKIQSIISFDYFNFCINWNAIWLLANKIGIIISTTTVNGQTLNMVEIIFFFFATYHICWQQMSWQIFYIFMCLIDDVGEFFVTNHFFKHIHCDAIVEIRTFSRIFTYDFCNSWTPGIKKKKS